MATTTIAISDQISASQSPVSFGTPTIVETPRVIVSLSRMTTVTMTNSASVEIAACTPPSRISAMPTSPANTAATAIATNIAGSTPRWTSMIQSRNPGMSGKRLRLRSGSMVSSAEV